MDETIKNDVVVEAPRVAPNAPKVEEKKAETNQNDEVVKVPAKFKTIVEAIENMQVLELNELVKVFEKKFGVSATAIAAPASGGGVAEAKEEKSTFIVELTDGGVQKIAVIKVVKEALALGLKDAKDKVDGAPTVLAEGMKKDDAEALKKKVEEAGGKVALK